MRSLEFNFNGYSVWMAMDSKVKANILRKLINTKKLENQLMKIFNERVKVEKKYDIKMSNLTIMVSDETIMFFSLCDLAKRNHIPNFIEYDLS